jgi:hypothetical protein
MVATTSLCKSILSDDGVLIVFSAIDIQTKKVLNSTLHNDNMKVLRTFICFNLYIVFKDPECPTYTVSITHHNCFYLIILVLFALYIVLIQFIFFVDSGIYGSCLGKGFYYQKIHQTTKLHFFGTALKSKNLLFNFVDEKNMLLHKSETPWRGPYQNRRIFINTIWNCLHHQMDALLI